MSQVIAQEDWDYSVNLKALKPDFMIHGDDWKVGLMTHIRDNCIAVLNSYGGKLIEIPYTPDVSASLLNPRPTLSSRITFAAPEATKTFDR